MSDDKRARLESDVHELRAAERRMQRDMGQHRRRESALVLRLVYLVLVLVYSAVAVFARLPAVNQGVGGGGGTAAAAATPGIGSSTA